MILKGETALTHGTKYTRSAVSRASFTSSCVLALFFLLGTLNSFKFATHYIFTLNSIKQLLEEYKKT